MTLKDVYGKGVLGLYTFYVEWAQKNGYSKIPSVLTFKEDICTLYNVEIDFTGEERRASQQVFTRRIAPTPAELEEVPF